MTSEKRLIDANAMREDWLENGENEYVYDTNSVLDSIDAQPTVDAVEVVHGQWLKVKDGFEVDRGWKCSNCNNSVYTMTYEPYEYCPHCGAMMDGERKKNG